MTKNKRFKLVNGIKKGTHSGIYDNRKQHNQGIGDELWLGEVVDMLNEGVAIVKENEELKQTIEEIYYTQIYKPTGKMTDELYKKIMNIVLDSDEE